MSDSDLLDMPFFLTEDDNFNDNKERFYIVLYKFAFNSKLSVILSILTKYHIVFTPYKAYHFK